ncbi:hypothetical protein WSM22_04390 [Cytophagales bacterium WSM2-2]|nr:hypothetical protein WSM22_04390 [Cytophagales bacterium WSM2-2]
MKKIVFLLLFASTAGFTQNYDADSVHYTRLEKPKAQNAETGKFIQYYFNVQSGALIGCNDCSRGQEVTYSFATNHGVTIGEKFRAGIGTGFDSYQSWQTLPLYALASWDLIGNKNKGAVYLQMTYGLAHAWFVRNGSYQYYGSDPFVGVSGGRTINPSIGYRLKYHDVKMAFAVGYKFQRISYKSAQYICPACDYFIAPAQSEITQDFNRIQLTMVVGWK